MRKMWKCVMWTLLSLTTVSIATFAFTAFMAWTLSGIGDTLLGVDEVHAPQRPNILYIMLDDVGYNDIGYHNQDIMTPHMDALAREGRILEQHYMQALCTPSRHALMTGMYPFKSRMQNFVIRGASAHCSPVNLEFLPKKLRKVGYKTHLAGKWHLGYCQQACMPLERGFDSFYGMIGSMADHFTHESVHPDIPGIYDWRDNNQPDYSANGTHSTDLITTRAVKLLSEHPGNQPFFMWLSYPAPHHPIMAPQKYLDLYRHIEDKNRRTVSAMLTHLDDGINDVVKALKQYGYYDNTLVVVTADNGGDVSAHHDNFPLRGAKASLWDGGSRAVSFVAGGVVKNAGETHHGLLHVTDWHQTILSLAGLPNDPKLDGLDQSDMLLRGRESKRTEIVYNIDLEPKNNAGQVAIRVGDYKLIWGFDGIVDGWGQDARLIWRYKPNLEELGMDVDALLKAKPGFMSVRLPWEQHVLEQLIKRRMFDPDDLDSGQTKLYNLADDPGEHLNLAEYSDHQERINALKIRVVALLADLVEPGDHVTEERREQAMKARQHGMYAPGWCEDVNLNLRT